MHLRSFVRCGLLMVMTLASMVGASDALAQPAYPSKPVKVVVPFPAGGATSVLARLLTDRLSQSMGQPFVIDNRAGAGGNIGFEHVARAEPDGYTLLIGTNGLAINPALYAKISFDPLKDFAPVSLYAGAPNLLLVTPSVPAKNLKELIAYARANPGKLNYASNGVGTSGHLSAEMLKAATGIFITHIPYRGGAPAMQDLMGGQVHMLFDMLPTSLPAAESGRVRALGITSSKRWPAAPQIPTISENIPNFEIYVWLGVLAPKGTPPQIITRLNAEISKILQDPAFQAQLAKAGSSPMPSTPAEFEKYLASETTRWTRIVKSTGARIE